MDAVISYAKTVLFFLLFVNLLMQLLKGSTYERFIHPICGMVLVILIVRPVLVLFDGDEKLLYAAEQKISLLFAQSEAEFELPETVGYEFVVLENYEKKLTEQLSGVLAEDGYCIVTADFSICAEEKEFGKIRGLSVVMEKTENEGGKKIGIAPIVFEREYQSKTPSAEEIRIKDKLADFYNLEEGNIYVSIKEGQDG
ncbi:MAG: stage III sporulation protein AF [Lachnospiraceae bacterium]|nr:stage III sporulation protein AF [Lachnospiraceae bacterium]